MKAWIVEALTFTGKWVPAHAQYIEYPARSDALRVATTLVVLNSQPYRVRVAGFAQRGAQTVEVRPSVV